MKRSSGMADQQFGSALLKLNHNEEVSICSSVNNVLFTAAPVDI